MKTTVWIIESERGWGQKVDSVKTFKSRKKAIEFCKRYNRKHNPPLSKAPNWYMYARLQDQEGFGMLR